MIIPRTFKQSIGVAICKRGREDYVLAETFDAGLASLNKVSDRLRVGRTRPSRGLCDTTGQSDGQDSDARVNKLRDARTRH